MNKKFNIYPFSALIGQDRLCLALLLCTINPKIGGVLIKGEKGTAKSTSIRGLAYILSLVDPKAKLVEFPIGSTEDRVLGSLDLRKALSNNEYIFSPGLLNIAHGGLLYIDEINLLNDHLVDILLDAASNGYFQIERDGVSHSQKSSFILVGTMNPEEGELRPQLLDRFGLTVDIKAPRKINIRANIVRTRILYEKDPSLFILNKKFADTRLANKVSAARNLVERVILPEIELRRIASICTSFKIDGMRADLVIARTAAAHAAWRNSLVVAEEDIIVATELALPHRCYSNLSSKSDCLNSESIKKIIKQIGKDTFQSKSEVDCTAISKFELPKFENNQTSVNQNIKKSDQTSLKETNIPFSIYAPFVPFNKKVLLIPGIGKGLPGRHSRAVNRLGTPVMNTINNDYKYKIHLFATITATINRQRNKKRLITRPEDIRYFLSEGRESNLIIFVVDTSGSMAVNNRMLTVNEVALSLLRNAYQKRDKVAVITFHRYDSYVLLPPTKSISIASRKLTTFSIGGKTPLNQGLIAARNLILQEKFKFKSQRSLVVIFTDGKATGGINPLKKAWDAAIELKKESSASIVVDCETSFIRFDLASQLAKRLNATIFKLEHLRSIDLTNIIKNKMDYLR